ncbi:odorant-binding protein-like [Choloepus didactylus]|uniref:odorant-binding protein-like n=1 Tax=Choloepus didactylus TaxID=27675 RepID=UPI0018A020CD|nr:odorant-binding protein-like [Choloepus didactylus]
MFYIKINGECLRFTKNGVTTGKDHKYDLDSKSNHVNADEYRKFEEVTVKMGIPKENILKGIDTGRGKYVDEELIEKFKELTRKEGIPEERITNLSETGKGIK